MAHSAKQATYNDMEECCGERWLTLPIEPRLWYVRTGVVFEDSEGRFWIGRCALAAGDDGQTARQINNTDQIWVEVELKTVERGEWVPVEKNDDG